ncbi:MAG: hypothetical protein HY320_09285 [Armatimonadetes bacterium]|nr:hypothetical protein [Armatimonadota bacterium]
MGHIGSAIFNSAGIPGLAGLLRPLRLGGQLTATLILFPGFCLLVFLFTLRGRTVMRSEGAFLLGAYLAYLSYSVVRP